MFQGDFPLAPKPATRYSTSILTIPKTKSKYEKTFNQVSVVTHTDPKRINTDHQWRKKSENYLALIIFGFMFYVFDILLLWIQYISNLEACHEKTVFQFFYVLDHCLVPTAHILVCTHNHKSNLGQDLHSTLGQSWVNITVKSIIYKAKTI